LIRLARSYRYRPKETPGFAGIFSPNCQYYLIGIAAVSGNHFLRSAGSSDKNDCANEKDGLHANPNKGVWIHRVGAKTAAGSTKDDLIHRKGAKSAKRITAKQERQIEFDLPQRREERKEDHRKAIKHTI
jgi:hypothetical protein